MAWSQADLDAIDAAIATGATSVKFGAGPDSREVHYRTLSQMLDVRTLIAEAIGVAPVRRRMSFIVHSRD